jgi:hypothetical protein
MEVVPYGLIHNKKQNIEKNSDRRGGTKMNEWERLRRQAQRYNALCFKFNSPTNISAIPQNRYFPVLGNCFFGRFQKIPSPFFWTPYVR